MNGDSSKHKRHKSHHHQQHAQQLKHHRHHRPGKSGKKQGSDEVNRLIEEGLRQQREKAEREAKLQQAVADVQDKSNLCPPQVMEEARKKKSDINSKSLGSVTNLFLDRQMGVQQPFWRLIRNNLSMLGNTHSHSVPLEEMPLDILSHCAHGMAYLYSNSINCRTKRNKHVRVFPEEGHRLSHLTWSMDTVFSILASISMHQWKGYIGITRMDPSGDNVQNELLQSSALYNSKYIDQIHSLHWGFHSHHIMTVDPKVVTIYDLEQGGCIVSKHHLTASKLSKQRDEETHCTTIAKNTLLSFESQTPTLFVGNRNGSVWQMDMRCGNSSSDQMRKIQQMTYCVDHIACMNHSSYYYLAQDICGNLIQYDIRKPLSLSTSRHHKSNSASIMSNPFAHGNGWLLAEGSRIAKGRFWLSPDNSVVATTNISPNSRKAPSNTTTIMNTSNTFSSLMLYHTHTGCNPMPTPLLKSLPFSNLCWDEAQQQQHQDGWECVKVLLAREMGPQPSESARMLVAMQESPKNRPSYLQYGSQLTTKYHLVSI